MEYIKEDKIISASEKAYKAVYKAQGYAPLEDAGPDDGHNINSEGMGVPNDEAGKLLNGEKSTDEADTVPDSEETDTGEADLADLKVDDLKELAKEAGITGYSSMRKDELAAALSAKA